MFAEELSGNAGRKRAEANRAKRRQLKQKKSQPTGTTKIAATSSLSLIGSTTTTSQPPSQQSTSSSDVGRIASKSLQSVASAAMSSTTSSSESKQVSALERANEQRMLRATESQQQNAAARIQSVYRRFHSNQVILRQNEILVKQRLRDLQTLSDILRQKKGITYVPPPATTTGLVRTLLWIAFQKRVDATACRTIVRVEALGKVKDHLQAMIQLCFLPSLRSKENHEQSDIEGDMIPFKVWIESNEGRLRFRTLLHLIMVVLLDMKSPDALFVRCLDFLRRITENGAASSSDPADDQVTFARSVVNPVDCKDDALISPIFNQHSGQKNGVDRMLAPIYDASTLWSGDLITVVRYYLLFIVAGPMPIPTQAEALRRESVSEKARQRAGALVQFAWENQDFANSEQASVRFLTHILTVPLLVWKLSSNALSFLLTPSSLTGVPPFLTMVFAFSKGFAKQDKHLGSFLPSVDVPLTQCPATNTQCLLGNLVQMGRLSAHVNGSSLNLVNFPWAQCYVEVLALVLDAIPVRTFSSRESAVEWISDGQGHVTPVVLSIVVLDQCKALFVDSYVRNLINCAVDTDRLRLDKVLQSKNDQDKETEQDIAAEAGSSATSLAAKESRMDRTRSFWNSSKWARRVSKGVAGLLSSSGNSKNSDIQKNSETGVLRNASSQSRALASGDGEGSEAAAASSREDYSPELLVSLCVLFSVVLARWGGGGGRDDFSAKAVSEHRKQKSADKEAATSFAEPFALSLLNTLCFSTQVLKATWCLIQSHDLTDAAVHVVIDPEKGNIPVRQLTCTPSCGRKDAYIGAVRSDRGAAVLYVFAASLSHTLIVTDDVEIHDFDRPLPLHQLRRVIKLFKKLLCRACALDEESRAPSTYFGLALLSASSRSFRDLYDRSSRRPLCLPRAWLETGLLEREIKSCNTHSDFVSLLNSAPVLRMCPMLVSFKRRLMLFDKIVRTNREELQGVNSPNPFNTNPLKPARVAVINRNRLLEDGLATMNHLGSQMRERISVHYVNEAGARETGIDAGGLFKEFWTDLCGIAFDPNYALFQVTEKEAGSCMYPSPASSSAHGRDHIVLFEFLGRIL